jgi:predicted PurR-regulated permease PerM
MKFKIIFYLFLFVCIILFFQLINTNKILNHQDRLIQNQNSLQLRLKDSLSNLKASLDVKKYFSLDGDQATKTEVEAVKTELMAFNAQGGLGELVSNLPEERFLIDNIQVVNTEWILIGFRSSQHWGQAFLTYKKGNDGYNFKTLESVVNPL